MNKNKEIEYAIKVIREWENLTLLEKLCRKKQKPSIIDYRLMGIWIHECDASVEESEQDE